MKILDVSPRASSPATCGASVRTFHLLRHLARRHEVRQFSLERGMSVRAVEEEKELAPSYR